MQTWTQLYTPLGSLWLSGLVAVIPIVYFFLALAVFRVKGHIAGLGALVITILLAIFAYRMPVDMALAAAGYGFVYGLWPIAWIIVTAVFLYRVAVKTGQFDVIRESILSITADQRLQMLLVGFAFGAFLEGAAGFGAPVAITAALLVGLGFNPLYAAALCLIANTAPVAFGGMGIPITVAGQVTGIDPMLIGQMAGRQLPFLSVIVPLWLVAIMDGWRGVRETWPALIVVGVAFAVTQYLTSNYIGPQLPDITSALAALVALALFLRAWKPKHIFRFDGAGEGKKGIRYGAGAIAKAWSPFIILTVLVTIWSLKPFKALFSPGGAFESTILKFHVPFLDQRVIQIPPVVSVEKAYAAVFKLDLISATGSAILIAALISMVLLRMRPRDALATFRETLADLRRPILAIGLVLAFAFVANYSGLSSTLALVLSGTGHLFPFFSPFLGWLGVFLTGSDTSSNALFSNLQSTTANQIGVSDTLLVAANTSGGVTGKMISPQSIAVATAAVGLVGKESDLFRFTFKHSLIFACFIGVLTYLQAYYLTWMIPK